MNSFLSAECKSAFVSLLSCAMLVTLTGCTQRHPEEDDKASENGTPTVTVRTASIVRGSLDIAVVATGKTDAIRKEKMYSPIGGTVVTLSVLEGTPVSRGQIVAVIQPRETRAAIVGAEALLQSARTESERAEAQHMLDLARAGQNNVAVRAGFDGVVASRSVAERELVTENAELLTIVDLSTITFVADVPLRSVSALHAGQRATIDFPSLPGRRFAALVESLSPQSDLQSQTLKVRLRFAGLAGGERRVLKTEMVGEARIVTAVHQNVLLVPKAALLRDDETERYSVVVATADSIARVVPVDIDGRNDSTAEVRNQSLVAGMNVVVEGNYALPDSSRILPVR